MEKEKQKEQDMWRFLEHRGLKEDDMKQKECLITFNLIAWI